MVNPVIDLKLFLNYLKSEKEKLLKEIQALEANSFDPTAAAKASFEERVFIIQQFIDNIRKEEFLRGRLQQLHDLLERLEATIQGKETTNA